MKLRNKIESLNELGFKAGDAVWIPNKGKCAVHIGRQACAVGVTKALATRLVKNLSPETTADNFGKLFIVA